MDELHIGLGLCGEEDTLTCHCCQVKSCECVLRERELVVAILWLWCSRSWVKPLHSFSITCTLGFSLCGVRDSLTLVCEFQSFLSFVRRLLSFLSLERETLILDNNGLIFHFWLYFWARMAQYWEQMSDTSVWKLSLQFLATLKKILRGISTFLFWCLFWCLFVFSSIVDV